MISYPGNKKFNRGLTANPAEDQESGPGLQDNHMPRVLHL